MSITELKNKLLKEGKKFAKEYQKIDLAFEVSEMVFEARVNVGFSQEKLAKKLKTKQSSIARIERGQSLPSLSFLQKIALALGTELLPPKFKNMVGATETSTAKLNVLDVVGSMLSPYTTSNFSSDNGLGQVTEFKRISKIKA